MIVTCVTVYVNEAHIQDFIDASIPNHQGSVKEPGNLRFDILQSVDDPTRFLLYEADTSKDAAAAHKQTDHYLEWRDTVADLMTKPREGNKHRVICPMEQEA